MDAASIAIIVGLFVLIAIIVAFLIVYAKNNDALRIAGQNLENTILVLLSAFERFGVQVTSSLGRLVSHLRDIFTSFLGSLSSAVGESVAFFGQAFQTVGTNLGTIVTQIATFSAEFTGRITQLITTVTTQITGKIATVPYEIGRALVLEFVKLLTEAFQTVTCFAINALTDIENFITPLIDGAVDDLKSVFNAAIGPIKEVVDQIYAIVKIIPHASVSSTEVYGLLSPLITPLQTSMKAIFCQGLAPICQLLPDNHCACEQIRCAGGCNAPGCCTPVCSC